jgi:hypothetical protein
MNEIKMQLEQTETSAERLNDLEMDLDRAVSSDFYFTRSE